MLFTCMSLYECVCVWMTVSMCIINIWCEDKWWWPGWPGWPLCMTNAWSPTRTHHHPPFNDGFIVILSEVNGGLGNARISLEVNIFIIIILHSMPFLSRLTLRECIVSILIASSYLPIFFSHYIWPLTPRSEILTNYVPRSYIHRIHTIPRL